MFIRSCSRLHIWCDYFLDDLDLRSKIRRRFVPSLSFYPDPGHITKAVCHLVAIQLLLGNDDEHQEVGFIFVLIKSRVNREKMNFYQS